MKNMAIFILLCCILSLSVCQASQKPAPAGHPGDKTAAVSENAKNSSGAGIEENPLEPPVAPDFTLPDLSGKKVTLSSLRGKVVLLDFGATWCPFCRKLMAHLQELEDQYKNKGLVILSINSGESKQRVARFMKENGYNFTVLLNDSDKLIMNYRAVAIPTLILVDKKGRMRLGLYGFGPKELSIINSAIAGLLKE
ncbi:MAG: TlpA family protein disulfide reductase [Chloroflexi bacterium]|nr:TlpA family protein disulfide reductase [Chloroflexota bacterium]